MGDAHDEPFNDQVQDQPLEEKWLSPMTFPMHVGNDCVTNNDIVQLDICAFIGWLPAAEPYPCEYAYFSRFQYPPCTDPSAVLDVNGSFSKLRADLAHASVLAGFSLVSNGNTIGKSFANRKRFPKGSDPPYVTRTFVCSCGPGSRKRKRLRKESREKPAKVSQQLEDDDPGGNCKEVVRVCPFRIHLYGDIHGFYIKRNSGSVKHCYHVKRRPVEIPIVLPRGARMERAVRKALERLDPQTKQELFCFVVESPSMDPERVFRYLSLDPDNAAFFKALEPECKKERLGPYQKAMGEIVLILRTVTNNQSTYTVREDGPPSLLTTCASAPSEARRMIAAAEGTAPTSGRNQGA